MSATDTASKQPTELSPTTMSPPTNFSNLPREPRNRIYEHAVVQYRSVSPLNRSWRQRPNGARYSVVAPNQPALALVSRGIRDEVLKTFFSRNAFNPATSRNDSRQTLTLTVKHWRSLMGDQLRHLRNIRWPQGHNVQDSDDVYNAPKGLTLSYFDLRLVRGVVTAQHTSRFGVWPKDIKECVCWLKRNLQASAGHDGKVLLDLLEMICAVTGSRHLKWVHCGGCNLHRLVDVSTAS